MSSEDVWAMDVDLPHGYKGVEMVDGLRVVAELVCLRDGVIEFTARKGL